MRVLISSVGTRGDVQPVLALAVEVRGLGHEVRLCIPPNFIDWAVGLGFEARPVGIEMRAPRPGAPPVVVPDLITDQFESVGSSADGCDLIVGGGAHQYAARSIAERQGIPCIQAVYAPVSIPSSDLAPPGQAEDSDGPAATQRLWDESRRSWNQRSLERVNANRTRLGLAPVDDVLRYILGSRTWLAADATLAPPASTPGIQVVQTGAWVSPDASPLPLELVRFLDAGDPPVYLGLGSMPAPEGTSRTLIDAVRAAGLRAILSRGWAGLALVDDEVDCIAIGEVNHLALFTRVAAVVHHGGAGTTTAAARAGVAQIAVPRFSDQFYWGRRIRALGIGTAVSGAGLSTPSLASALQEALEPSVAARARALSGAIISTGAAIAARRLVEEQGGSPTRSTRG